MWEFRTLEHNIGGPEQSTPVPHPFPFRCFPPLIKSATHPFLIPFSSNAYNPRYNPLSDHSPTCCLSDASPPSRRCLPLSPKPATFTLLPTCLSI